MTDWRDVLEAEPIGDCRKVADMCCDIEVYRQARSLILLPTRKVRALHAGHGECGYVYDPQAIVNTTSLGSRSEMSIMERPPSENDAATCCTLKRLDLDPKRVVSFGTAAHMDNAVVSNTVSEDGVKVSVAVTAGIRGNAGRAGDPAAFDEVETYPDQKSGTIVIIVAIDAALTEGAMLDAAITATQAKSAVIMETQKGSLYSHGIATGSGTDQVGIICLGEGFNEVGSVQPGTDIGRTVGKCVRKALSDAFVLQSGMDPASQCDPFIMLERFGIGYKQVGSELRYPCTWDELVTAGKEIRRDPDLAAGVSACLHIQDEIDLGRVAPENGMAAARTMVDALILHDVKGPVEEAIMNSVDTVPDLVSVALATALGNKAVGSRGEGA